MRVHSGWKTSLFSVVYISDLRLREPLTWVAAYDLLIRSQCYYYASNLPWNFNGFHRTNNLVN